MTGSIRCFVAIELPGELRERITEAVTFLKSSRTLVKWVPPENLHLTVKFLGGVPEEDLPQLIKVLEEAVRETKPFEIEVSGAGVFPGMKYPRVFWIGARDPGAGLERLADRVEGALEHFGPGYPREKRGFTAHLTIGRLRERARLKGEEAQGLASGLATLKDVLFGKIKLENISLMRSELGPGGARYSRLAKIEFGGFQKTENMPVKKFLEEEMET